MTFEDNVDRVLGELKTILLEKNEKYGNSALEPVRIFSKASAKEQILVRLDDKLSRLRTQHVDEDEDVATDLLGYLVLLKVADLQSPMDDRIEVTTHEDTTKQFDNQDQMEYAIRGKLFGDKDYSFAYIDHEGYIMLNNHETGVQFAMTDYDEFIGWYEENGTN